jgi:hypothetical protein
VGTKEKPKDGMDNVFVAGRRPTDLTANTILLDASLTIYGLGSKYFFHTGPGQFCRCERRCACGLMMVRACWLDQKAFKNAVRHREDC